MNPDSGRVLRPELQSTCRIKKLSIDIEVHPDLRTAHYVYDLSIEPTAAFDGLWRDVFAYPKDNLTEVRVTAGDSSGLKWDMTSLETPAENACLTIQLDGMRHFGYQLDTRIESMVHRSLFGDDGWIGYWTAHEYPCDSLQVSIQVPHGVEITSTHPAPDFADGKGVVQFARRGRAPMEFFLASLTFKKTFLGMSPAQANFLDKAVWALLGAGISWGLSLLLLPAGVNCTVMADENCTLSPSGRQPN